MFEPCPSAGFPDKACGPGLMCDGKGSMECKNPTRVYDAIKALYGKGIHTFVVGFDLDTGGLALAIVRGLPGQTGRARVVAESDGLEAAAITITVTDDAP